MSIWEKLIDSGLRSPERAVGEVVSGVSAPSNDERHQFIVLLKPELIDFQSTADVEATVRLVVSQVEDQGIRLCGIRWFTGTELRQSRLMERHYGAINEVSRLGLFALDDTARTRFDTLFGNVAEADVFGAHAYLDEFPSATASDLRQAFSDAGAHKIAPGVYAASVAIGNRNVVLLNGFHPAQLDHFTGKNSRLIALECRSDKPWPVLRRHIAGATDPTSAVKGSLRAVLREQSGKLGLGGMSINKNGIHLSAGPVEGCAEVIRFFASDEEIQVSSTVLGSELSNAGAPVDRIRAALNNELVCAGESVFDATEDMDIDEAVQLILDPTTHV